MKYLMIIAVFAFFALGTSLYFGKTSLAMQNGVDLMNQKPENYPVAVLAGGCFWCTESEFRAIDGVLYTRVGYAGGEVENPTYEQITTGKTGHAEATEVTYDPDKISYEELLTFFLTKAHDPTQMNRQGVDVGTQYRSAIFYADEEQKRIAEQVIAKIDAEAIYKKTIVTTIEPLETFWLGEDYHQQYYEKYEDKTGAPHIRVLMKKAKRR